VAAGDAIEFLSRDSSGITIDEANRVYAHDRYNRQLLERAIATPALPEEFREYYARRLAAVKNQED
jgi:MOSC domain-containing protein YiiM